MGFLNVILDRFSDLFMRHMKLFLLVMFAMAGGSFVWFTLMCVDVIPLSTGKSNCRFIKHCVVNEPYLILNSDSKPCILVANLFRGPTVIQSLFSYLQNLRHSSAFCLTAQVYISNIVGGMSLNGAIPLFYELGAESGFPVSEGVVGGFLTWLNNLCGVMFLFMLQIPNIGEYFAYVSSYWSTEHDVYASALFRVNAIFFSSVGRFISCYFLALLTSSSNC